MSGYQDALNQRINWVEDQEIGRGQVTYVGNYCVITGLPHIHWEALYGTSPNWVSMMYWVGIGSMTGPDVECVARYECDSDTLATTQHYRLLAQASAMDLLEITHEW